MLKSSLSDIFEVEAAEGRAILSTKLTELLSRGNFQEIYKFFYLFDLEEEKFDALLANWQTKKLKTDEAVKMLTEMVWNRALLKAKTRREP